MRKLGRFVLGFIVSLAITLVAMNLIYNHNAHAAAVQTKPPMKCQTVVGPNKCKRG